MQCKACFLRSAQAGQTKAFSRLGCAAWSCWAVRSAGLNNASRRFQRRRRPHLTPMVQVASGEKQSTANPLAMDLITGGAHSDRSSCYVYTAWMLQPGALLPTVCILLSLFAVISIVGKSLQGSSSIVAWSSSFFSNAARHQSVKASNARTGTVVEMKAMSRFIVASKSPFGAARHGKALHTPPELLAVLGCCVDFTFCPVRNAGTRGSSHSAFHLLSVCPSNPISEYYPVPVFSQSACFKPILALFETTDCRR